MENATKALLISASVLIVIVLIAISIKVLNSTNKVTSQSNTVSTNMEVSMFNSNYEQYFGTKVSGTQVKSLISKIIVNNAQDSKHEIALVLRDSSSNVICDTHHTASGTTLKEVYNNISNVKSYQVYVTSSCTVYTNGYNNGYIACITIRENS